MALRLKLCWCDAPRGFGSDCLAHPNDCLGFLVEYVEGIGVRVDPRGNLWDETPADVRQRALGIGERRSLNG